MNTSHQSNKKTRGGPRAGSGRTIASAPYKEKTKPIRIPISLIPHIKASLRDLKRLRQGKDIAELIPVADEQRDIRIPLFADRVAAGFPSPADDFVEKYLNLNELLIKQVDSTFFVRVIGHSMVDANIYPDDILIVDRSVEPKHNKVVIAVLENELTVKRLDLSSDKPVLRAENPEYPDIAVNEELMIWGVVTSVIHQM